jgi:DNA (cytosine-5)-methyltransferase 1
MKVLSLFSGVGGFDLGLEAAGMQTIYQCEWDKHATSILNKHWPDVPKWGDITTLTASEILRHGQMPDVVAWGSPCQDLSVAGKRAGLAGERSGLFHEGIRIIKELRKATNNEYPRFSIWENVAGALSSNGGSDFGAVIDEMAEAGALVIEWAVLDAQHFGIPQRRRRVFVIAVFDPAIASRCPEPLLPVGESLRGNPAKGKPQGETTTREATAGFGSGSFGGGSETLLVEPFVKSRRAQTSDDDETWVEGVVNPTLNSFDVGDTRATTAIVDFTHDSEARVNPTTSPSLQARMGTGGNQTPCVFSFDTQFGSNANVTEEVAPTVKASQQAPSIQHNSTVRRLTPLECERLMGWPDNWTEGQADTHRYKQCGNGVASPVAQWIAQHLLNI